MEEEIYKTLRDEIAMISLRGAFECDPMDFWARTDDMKEGISRQAYRWADAMLKVRESNSTASPTRT